MGALQDTEKSNDRYFDLLTTATGFFRMRGENCEPIAVNAAMRGFLGLTDQEIAQALQVSPVPFVATEDAERIAIILYKARITGGDFREKVQIKTADGSYQFAEFCMNTQQQTDGTAMSCIQLFDSRQQLQQQKKLDSTYNRLLEVLNNAPGGIMTFETINNRTLVPAFASQGMERLLQGSMETLRNTYRRDVYQWVHADDRERIVRTIEDALRNLSPFRLPMRLQTVPGDYIWVAASGTVDNTEHGRVLYIAFLEAPGDAEYLHIQEQVLQNFVRKQYEHVCYLDAKHNTYRMLSTTCKKGSFLKEAGDRYEQDIAEYVQKNVIAQEQETVKQRLSLKAILDHLELQSDDEFYCTVQDSKGKLQYKKIWISWIDKETKTIALVTSDVTQQHRQSEESREALLSALHAAAQASKAKSEFLSRMSHDIRTPLNAIIGFLEMSLEETPQDARIREYLSKAEASSEFLLTLINDVLNMSRIESGKLALRENTFSMQKFLHGISSIMSSQCAAKRLHFDCELDHSAEGSFRGDQLKLQQILLNIIGNAVKFTPQEGRITLQVSGRQEQNIVLVTFRIADTGCGISEEFLQHLFDPFAQEKRALDSEIQGTGLGLAICKSLTEMMDGKIAVSSVVGKGSVFTLTIPMHSAEQKEAGNPALEADNGVSGEIRHFAGKRILLAEDNNLNMEIAKHVLVKAGLLVDTACNGKEAVKCFTEAENWHYSAILMDIRMPEMDGLQATKQIRASGRPDHDIPIIAMSANAFEEDIREAIAEGMNAYTTKPIHITQLYDTLCRFIKE